MAALKMKWYEILRDRRRRLDLTQTELAKIAKVDRTIVANIETGRRQLSDDGVAEDLWEALRKVAAKRGMKFVSGTELIKATEEEIEKRKGLEAAERPEEAQEKFIRQFDGLSTFARYAALDAVAKGKATVAEAVVRAKAPWLNLLAAYSDLNVQAQFQEMLKAQEADRKRQLAALENATSLDDPIVKEVIQLFRDEIAKLEELNEVLLRELSKANADSD